MLCGGFLMQKSGGNSAKSIVQSKGIDMIIAHNYYIIVKKRQAKKSV